MWYEIPTCQVQYGKLTRNRTKKISVECALVGTVLQNVDKIEYLGVTITEDLRWNTNVKNICTKANRTLGFLRQTCPQDVMEAV